MSRLRAAEGSRCLRDTDEIRGVEQRERERERERERGGLPVNADAPPGCTMSTYISSIRSQATRLIGARSFVNAFPCVRSACQRGSPEAFKRIDWLFRRRRKRSLPSALFQVVLISLSLSLSLFLSVLSLEFSRVSRETRNTEKRRACRIKDSRRLLKSSRLGDETGKGSRGSGCTWPRGRKVKYRGEKAGRRCIPATSWT